MSIAGAKIEQKTVTTATNEPGLLTIGMVVWLVLLIAIVAMASAGPIKDFGLSADPAVWSSFTA